SPMKPSGIFPSIVKTVKKNERLNQNLLVRTLAKYYYKSHNAAVRFSRAYKRPLMSVIGPGCTIHPRAYIADRGVKIGNNCRIEESAVIMGDSVVEDNVTIGSGSVIGSEGFQFRRFHDELIPVVHVGGVRILSGVHIGPRSCVDKATFGGFTEIGDHSSLGVNTHVAHDVVIGKNCHIHSSMISGHTHLGDVVTVGYGAAISNALSIGDHVWIAPRVVVTKNVPGGHRIETGNTHIKFLKIFCALGDYPEKNDTLQLAHAKTEISESAVIHPTAHIADTCVRIGDLSVIGPNASILEGSILGKGVTIGPGSIVGVGCCQPHPSGGVIIHDYVDIQANTHIDRSTAGKFTEIGEFSKIDNLVHIGADVIIGKRSLIVASSIIGGGSKIGDDVWVGPCTLISNNLTIGDQAYITLGSVITKDVKEGKVMIGDCAIDRKHFFSFVKSDH
ncbi:MAG: DapH/DapD/GlmU-related protein, partial [Euryarchaeota archaeon]|nr:DapH/DapD/GlmU-related protein [Euryarchaeota archaeon]